MKFYRVENYSVSISDGYGEHSHSEARTRLLSFDLIKETKCFYVIGTKIFPEDCRKIKKNANKRFACPTKEEAWESFLARKRRQIQIMEKRIRLIKHSMMLKPPGF